MLQDRAIRVDLKDGFFSQVPDLSVDDELRLVGRFPFGVDSNVIWQCESSTAGPMLPFISSSFLRHAFH